MVTMPGKNKLNTTLLGKAIPQPFLTTAPEQDLHVPQECINDSDGYVAKILQHVAAGAVNLKGNPWIMPGSPFQEVMAIDIQREAGGERHVVSQ